MDTAALLVRLKALPTLSPPSRLVDRLHVSIATGAEPRIQQPLVPASRKPWLVTAVAAAVLVAMSLLQRQVPAERADAGGDWLLPRLALAQSPVAGFRSLDSLVPARIRPGRWTYQGWTRGPDGFVRDLGLTVIEVVPGKLGTTDVWVMTRRGKERFGTGVESVDSVVVRQATLEPLARTRVPWGGAMTFHGDSVLVEVPRAGLRKDWPLPPMQQRPYLVELATLMPAVPFGPGMRIGVPILAMYSPGGPILSLSMEVEALEMVNVPAGSFHCYRVRVGGRPDGDVWWIDTESGRLVKTAAHWAEDMLDERLLVEVRPGT